MEQLLRALGRYRRAALYLTWISFLGILNFFLSVSGRRFYFFIGAFMPKAIFLYGKAIAGISGQIFLTGGAFLAICLCALYVYLRYRSAKSGRVLTVAAVLYGLDTAALFLFSLAGYGLPGLADTVLHVYVLTILVRGARAGWYLDRVMQSDTVRMQLASLLTGGTDMPVDAEGNTLPANGYDTIPLRPEEPKNAYLFHRRYGGMEIRVAFSPELTELSVNGMVYAECRGRWEPAHALSAVVSGHCICVGLCRGTSCPDMILEVDGREIDRFRR